MVTDAQWKTCEMWKLPYLCRVIKRPECKMLTVGLDRSISFMQTTLCYTLTLHRELNLLRFRTFLYNLKKTGVVFGNVIHKGSMIYSENQKSKIIVVLFEVWISGLMLLSFLWVMLRKSAAQAVWASYFVMICWDWRWSLCHGWFDVGMENEEHFLILPAHKLYGDADFFFQQSLAGVRSSKTKGNGFWSPWTPQRIHESHFTQNFSSQ